jgi:hypothetical protein
MVTDTSRSKLAWLFSPAVATEKAATSSAGRNQRCFILGKPILHKDRDSKQPKKGFVFDDGGVTYEQPAEVLIDPVIYFKDRSTPKRVLSLFFD